MLTSGPSPSLSAHPPQRSAALHSTPKDDTAALSVVDALRALAPVTRAAAELVHDLTGLHPVPLAVLQAVAAGQTSLSEAAALAGLDVTSAAACVEQLVTDGLLDSSHPGETTLLLTDLGQVRASQADALQVRLADGVLRAVGDELGQRLVRVVGDVAHRLTGEPVGDLPT